MSGVFPQISPLSGRRSVENCAPFSLKIVLLGEQAVVLVLGNRRALIARRVQTGRKFFVSQTLVFIIVSAECELTL